MVKRLLISAMTALSFIPAHANAADNNEISPFDSSGKPVAYIALDEEMTIYLWGGKPVAYLKRGSDGYDVYGFNGEHLGWFLKGAVWDHDGAAACAVKEMMQSTAYEPYKSYKQYKPYKSYTKYAPYQPSLTGKFGPIPCQFLLAEGGK